MGIFNPSDANEAKIEKQYNKILGKGEKVIIAYKLIRDLIILTNYRLIIIDKQGITGKKQLIKSYSLNKITHYHIENAPYFDIESEVSIYFTGIPEPVKFTLSKGTDVYEFNKILTSYALGQN